MLWIEFSSVVVETWADCWPPLPASEAIEYMDMRFAMLSTVGAASREGHGRERGYSAARKQGRRLKSRRVVISTTQRQFPAPDAL